jgi:acyl-CoA thioesterase I
MTAVRFKRVLVWISLVLALLAPVSAGAAGPVRILAFGTSLTQGYGLPPGTEFTAVMQTRLKQAGIDASFVNAGVSGDTSSDGLSRLDWSLADKPDAVIVEMGSNDALRGIDPALTEKNLAAILGKLRAAHLPVLLLGMKAPRNLGPQYAKAFDAMYPALAKEYGVILYPFVLDGVALNPKLNQADGMHPNPAGVKVIVDRMLPYVEKLVAEAKR